MVVVAFELLNLCCAVLCFVCVCVWLLIRVGQRFVLRMSVHMEQL